MDCTLYLFFVWFDWPVGGRAVAIHTAPAIKASPFGPSCPLCRRCVLCVCSLHEHKVPVNCAMHQHQPLGPIVVSPGSLCGWLVVPQTRDTESARARVQPHFNRHPHAFTRNYNESSTSCARMRQKAQARRQLDGSTTWFETYRKYTCARLHIRYDACRNSLGAEPGLHEPTIYAK